MLYPNLTQNWMPQGQVSAHPIWEIQPKEKPLERDPGDQAVRFLRREGACVALLLALQLAHPMAGAAGLVLLAAWSLRSPRAVIQALSVAVLVVSMNTAFTGPRLMVPALKWVLLAVCASRLCLTSVPPRRRPVPGWVGPLLLFGSVTLLLVLGTSSNIPLSLFKLLSFLLGVTTTLRAFQKDELEPGYWLNWFFTLHCVVLFLSLPLLFVPQGYLPGYFGFRGILEHSQAYGVYLVPITAFLCCAALSGSCRSLLSVSACLLGFHGILASACRTAVAALVLGILITLLFALIARRELLRSVHRTLLALTLCTVGTCLASILLFGFDTFASSLISFTVKRRGFDDVSFVQRAWGSFEGSRGHVVRSLVDTIKQRPLAGMGFGIAASGVRQQIDYDEFTGLPVSAPIEQGFLPMAVLAQVGILGAIPFGLFLAALFRPVFGAGALPLVALFLCTFLTMFGEMIVFSMGALGLQVWLITSLSYQGCARASSFYGSRILAQHPQPAPVRLH